MDEPLASFMREVLEGYATDRFETQSEVKRFIENSSVFMNSRKSPITYQVVKRILENPLYAGYMNVPEWGIFLQPGKHEPLISFQTQTIEDKIKGKARAPARFRHLRNLSKTNDSLLVGRPQTKISLLSRLHQGVQ